MKVYRIARLFVASLALTMISCGGDADHSDHTKSYTLQEELRPMHDEIMEIHDEMMPKLSQITSMQTDLRERLDMMRGQAERKDELIRTNAVLADLNRAEDAMWSWMHGFGSLDTIAPQKQEAWLRKELSSVEQMKNIMLSGIEKAENFLQ